MKPLRYLPHYTYEDYKIWEGDWELIQGIPYSMSPSPFRRHQLLAGNLFSELKVQLIKLKDACKSCSVYYELDWIISDDTIVRPDIMMVCGKFEGDFLDFPPTLIIEILSPNTALKDRTAKFEIYQDQKVKYYLLADPKSLTIKTFILVDNNYVETIQEKFVLDKKCQINLDITSILKAST